MKNKIVGFLCLIIMISGCSSKSETNKENVIVSSPVVKGEYQVLSHLASNDTRQTHVEFNRGFYDRNAIGSGLVEFSKAHFDPSEYYLMEGQILSRNDLQTGVVFDDKSGLLGRRSDDNEYGLNPASDSQLRISNTAEITVGSKTTPIVDIFELNFTKEAVDKPNIDGISLAIVVSSEVVDKDGKTHKIEDDMLLVIGEQAALTVIDFLRKKPEIGNKTPIYITLFNATSTDDSLPGTFIAQSFGKEGVSFKKINEKWVLFPSSEATTMDPAFSQQFELMRKELFLIIPNDTGVIGKGKFVDNQLTTLQITVRSQAKTYTEAMAVVQTMRSMVASLGNDHMSISVRFINDEEVYAMIEKVRDAEPVVVRVSY